jgi:hypothetical protein
MSKIVIVNSSELWLYTDEQGTLGPAKLEDVFKTPWSSELEKDKKTKFSGMNFSGYTTPELRALREAKQLVPSTVLGPRERLFTYANKFDGGSKKVGDAIRAVAENGFSADVNTLLNILTISP